MAPIRGTPKSLLTCIAKPVSATNLCTSSLKSLILHWMILRAAPWSIPSLIWLFQSPLQFGAETRDALFTFSFKRRSWHFRLRFYMGRTPGVPQFIIQTYIHTRTPYILSLCSHTPRLKAENERAGRKRAKDERATRQQKLGSKPYWPFLTRIIEPPHLGSRAADSSENFLSRLVSELVGKHLVVIRTLMQGPLPPSCFTLVRHKYRIKAPV